VAITISTTDLARQLGNPTLAVIDVRPMAAYNGWRLQGEARGGHMHGAVAFPLSWTDGIEAADLKMLLQSKGITQDRSVVVYGYTCDESADFVTRFSDLGYEEVLAYEASLAE
jgi:3-mercaptopyruvate sulfurtransferase SseA